MTLLSLFCSTFALVFFLGMQSLVVNAGRRTLAFANSFCIGAAHLILYKLAPEAAGIEIAAYLLGGPFGIVAAMAVFERLRHRHTAAKK